LGAREQEQLDRTLDAMIDLHFFFLEQLQICGSLLLKEKPNKLLQRLLLKG
jgi:hypothetical protein